MARLPGAVVELSGGLPPLMAHGKSLLSFSLISRAWRLVRRRTFGWKLSHYSDEALARFLATERIDAVLAEYGPTAVSLLNACRAAKVPLVAHFHGYDAYEEDTVSRCREGYSRLFREAAAIVAVSRDMVRRLEELGAPKDKIVYNPCGVDEAEFPAARPGDNAPMAVAVGRFVDKKAPHLVLQAFAEARKRVPEARLLMFGDGPLLHFCRDEARALGLDGAVQFAGARPHDEIARAMSNARVFLQHSVRGANGDCEGTPVSVMEALAAGLPVVATAHGGIRDIVKHGETGILVNEGDVEGMGQEAGRLLADGRLAARMGEAARRSFPEQCRMDKSLSVLQETLSRAAFFRS